MKFTISPAPHIKSQQTTKGIMLSVFLALLPSGIWGIYKFGIHSGYVILTSIVSCVFFEFVSQKFIFKTKVKITDGSAALTGLLMAYCLPPGIALWQVCIGSFFAIFITKECFGGIGFNIFNPALVGRAVLLSSFPTVMTKWQIDGITSATPLGILKEKLAQQLPSYTDLFVGNIPGSIGEVSKILLLLGAIFLFYRRIISWHIPLTFVLTVMVLSVPFKQDPIFQILSGGVILGAFFMATDYVTSPLFLKGKIILGFGCGLLTVLIRNLGAYPEGVCYSILIMNILVPLIDKFTKPKIFGAKK
ncbi:MAG: RnfABCDGE type electron transport complex subunit D [Elusimicrobiota bacterium]|nr:RnfABCDGE type electron transport complex subunit D [Elusimicrobiota bacterium]